MLQKYRSKLLTSEKRFEYSDSEAQAAARATSERGALFGKK